MIATLLYHVGSPVLLETVVTHGEILHKLLRVAFDVAREFCIGMPVTVAPSIPVSH